MKSAVIFRNLFWLVLVSAVGGLPISAWKQSAVANAQTTQAPRENGQESPNIQADVTRLKDIVPPASHPMVDVGYHAANLWFAAQKKNWPLANYYLGETRNRLRWEVRLNPAPKGATGEPVDMKSTLDGIENGTYNKVKEAIDKKDSAAFVVAYKHLLEDCYSCHKAANRPYLRPMVPLTPMQPIINTDPTATWPE